jgi:hypothetical protein
MHIGTRVSVRGAFLDEAMTEPVTGTIEDVLANGYPDENGHFDGLRRYVVMFDHTDPRLSPGGEFTAERLQPLDEAACSRPVRVA